MRQHQTPSWRERKFGQFFPLFSVKMTFFGKNAKKVAKKFGGFIKKLLSLQTHKL